MNIAKESWEFKLLLDAIALGLTCVDNDGAIPATLAQDTSTWVDILTGGDIAEDGDVQRRVVRQLTELIGAWNPGTKRHIVVTTSGGISFLKPLFERVPATCLGQSAVRLLDNPERRGAQREPATLTALNYDDRVAERETLRFHCAEALRHGDYVGAYGLASRCESNWTQGVRDILGPFLNLPGNPLGLMYHSRPLHRFEIYSVQVEVRLQAGDASGAVLALRSFLEAATWYLLVANTAIREAGLTPSPETESVDGVWPTNRATELNIAGLLERDQDGRRNQHKVSKLLLDGLAWLRNNANPEGHFRHAVEALVELRDIYDRGNPSLRKCRNSIAHGAGGVIMPDIIRGRILDAEFDLDQPFGENFLGKNPGSNLLANLEAGTLRDVIKRQFGNLLDRVIQG